MFNFLFKDYYILNNLFWIFTSITSNFILYPFIFKNKLILFPFIISLLASIQTILNIIAIVVIKYKRLYNRSSTTYHTIYFISNNDDLNKLINNILYANNSKLLETTNCYYDYLGNKNKILYTIPQINDSKIDDKCTICFSHFIHEQTISLCMYIIEDTQEIKLNIILNPLIKCKNCKTIFHSKCLIKSIKYNKWSCPVCRL